METKFESVFTDYGKPVDSRSLTLAFEFYDLDEVQVCALSHYTLNWLLSFIQDNFIESWAIGRKSTTKKRLYERLAGEWSIDTCAFAMDGYVRTDNLSTKKQVTELITNTSKSLLMDAAYNPSSNDYYVYWHRTFPNGRCANDLFLKQMYELFREKGKKKTSVYSSKEIDAMFVPWPYSNNSSKYHGIFHLSICAHCLGNAVDSFAEMFAQQLCRTAKMFVKINGRVMLQPFCPHIGHSPYMTYFRANPVTDGSHLEFGCRPNEWYETYYMCGVEWANVLSPLVRKHLPALTGKYDAEFMECKELDGGALFVRSKKSVSVVDVDDLAQIKEVVYDALFPGRWHLILDMLFDEITSDALSIHLAPRGTWERVPIFDQEMRIFCSQEYLMPEMCLGVGHKTYWAKNENGKKE